jgi:hypothetical protein
MTDISAEIGTMPTQVEPRLDYQAAFLVAVQRPAPAAVATFRALSCPAMAFRLCKAGRLDVSNDRYLPLASRLRSRAALPRLFELREGAGDLAHGDLPSALSWWRMQVASPAI